MQALLEHYNIDVAKATQRFKHLATYDVERVAKILAFLEELGVDVKRVVEVKPRLLAGQVELYQAVVQLLLDNDVDIVRAINGNPEVLSRRVVTLQRTMDAITSCGHVVADVVHRRPAILRASVSDVASMLKLHNTRGKRVAAARPAAKLDKALSAPDPKSALFAALGLDTELLLKRAPGVLSISPEKLQEMVTYLKHLGVDVPKVARAAPQLLMKRPEALQQRVQFLKANRLNVVRHINSQPTVLAYCVEQKLKPTLAFVLKEMQRTREEVDGTTAIWSISLEGRLRPRFLYLRSLGLEDVFSLNRLCIYPDDRFASELARTSLQQYYDWRLQSGFPTRGS
eukprot:EG_transcript_8382